VISLELPFDKEREKALNKQSPTEDHCSRKITKDTIIIVDGKPAVILLTKLDVVDLFMAVKKINNFYQGSRGSGLKNEARVFGFSPRMPTRNHHDYCSISNMSIEFPEAHKKLMEWGITASDLYKKHSKEMWTDHKKWITDNIRSEWLMPKSVFSSGIVNRTSQLKYHYDRGNIENGWSCMFTLKDGIQGGDLSIPGLDVTVSLPHGSALLFNGQKILHGVTPIHRRKPGAERYTIVYYTLAQMRNCMSPADEIKRAQKIRDSRETSWLQTRAQK